MFSRSADVKDAASILDSAPKYSIHYTSLFALRLIRASKPGLLHNSKLLPEPVWQQRTTVCLVALYYLSRDVEKILFHSREIVAGFFPIFQLAVLDYHRRTLSEPSNRIDVGVCSFNDRSAMYCHLDRKSTAGQPNAGDPHAKSPTFLVITWSPSTALFSKDTTSS